MMRISLPVLLCLATLVFFTALAHSAEPQITTDTSPDPRMASASAVSVKPSLFNGKTDVSMVNLMINLLDSKVGYRLDESTAIFLVCSPFADQQTDDPSSHPASDFSVGFKVFF